MSGFCVDPPVVQYYPDCCVADICFQCGLTMPSDEKMARDFQWADYFIAVVLFFVGVWNMVSFYRVYRENNNYISIMRIGNTIYAFGTGIFGLARIHYQLGKPLLVFAAIHNLCEWIFVAFAFYKNKKQREYAIFGSTVWIFMIIGLILIVFTEFPAFALAEQTTGISLDFMLPFVWFILWRQNRQNRQKNDNNKNKPAQEQKISKSEQPAVHSIADIYMVALVAHSIHILFTILPLVVVNFIRDRNELLSRIIEFLIFLSVPLTHILYTRFTDLHEQAIDLPSYRNSDDDGPANYSDNLVVQKSPIDLCIKKNKSPFIKVLSWYVLCIIIGLFPTVIIPAAIPICEQTEEASKADDTATDNNNNNLDTIFVGTSTGIVHEGMSAAFEDYILSKNLVENGRNFPGNVFYYFNKDVFQPNRYFFVEGWESMEVVQNWIKTDYVRAAFNNYTYQMLEGGALKLNAYQPLSRSAKHEDKYAEGAIKHTFKGFNGCDDIGEDMINLLNCDWIMGCDHVEIVDESKGDRKLILMNGHELTNQCSSLKKEVNGTQSNYTLIHYIAELDREYYIELISDPVQSSYDECHGLFSFKTNIEIETIDSIYDGFVKNNIPYLQQKYEAQTEMPKNEVSSRLLGCKTAEEFIETIIEVQADPVLYKEYQRVAPYLYTENGQMIYNGKEFNGIKEIKALYAAVGGGVSQNTQHSLLMDPIIEDHDNTTLVTIVSNVKQKTLSGSDGCDYTFPMYLQVELTKTYPIKINKLLYNTPSYSVIEQGSVLKNCQYLTTEKRKELSTNKGFKSSVYQYWDGFKIMNEENAAAFVTLFGPYIDPTVNTLYSFNNTDYYDPMKFHEFFVGNILSGYRFYVVSLIANNGFITVGLRGNIISPDLKENYNDNFRFIIDYYLDENDKIEAVINHIDSKQLKDIINEFNDKDRTIAVCQANSNSDSNNSAQTDCKMV